MSRSSKMSKSAEWRRRLAQYEKSKQTVSQFCLDEGISQPSFYLWKKRLLGTRTDTACAPRRFQPVHVTSSLAQSSRQETIVRLGQGVQIEFGSDLAVVEAVVKQLLETAGCASSPGGPSC